jgi:hypothetical protein
MSEQPASQERPTVASLPGGRLQVLATEHWSLLATRSLVYAEAFSRVTMFLSVLTGAVIALALLAQVDHSHRTLLIFAVLILAVVFFVGLATIVRLAAINRENYRWVMGMNRLRHAYLEMYPDLAPYFVAGTSDDLRGVLLTMSVPMGTARSPLTRVARGFQSLPGMVAVVVAVVGAALAAMIVALAGGSTLVAGVLGSVVFVATSLVFGLLARRVTYAESFEPRFTSEEEAPSSEEEAPSQQRAA